LALKAMAFTGRRVIFYDQLGCGRSSLPEPHPDMWTVPLFVEEVAIVRQALRLDRIHLVGHSWGGMLALEYLFARPGGIASLTLASTPVSMPQWAEEANRLLDEMPPEVGDAVRRHEAAGTVDDPEYMAAMTAFRARHFAPRRTQPKPSPPSGQPVPTDPQVNLTMYGPLVFDVRGTLKDWDVHERLGEIDVPTLVTSGRFDMATPAIAQAAHAGIRGSELVIFEESAHLPHADEPERYTEVLGEFVARNEP
jgi:proline-specific peptidase